jgi:hypothetical protein
MLSEHSLIIYIFSIYGLFYDRSPLRTTVATAELSVRPGSGRDSALNAGRSIIQRTVVPVRTIDDERR